MQYLEATTETCSLRYMFFKIGKTDTLNKDMNTLEQSQIRSTSSSE